MKEIKLFDADTLEYSGSILVKGQDWEYSEVKNEYLINNTESLPLKLVLTTLISFNLVYDIISD